MLFPIVKAKPLNPRRIRARRKRPLAFEPLEQRIEPAPVFWVGASGDWSAPTNWSTGLVPGPGDEVVIDANAGLTISITSPQSVDSIAMTGNDHLAIAGGSLTLTQASDINDLQMSAGTFTSSLLSTLTGTCSLSGDATWQGLFRNDATLTMTDDPNLTDVTLNNTGTVLEAGARLDLSGNVTINNTLGSVFDITGAGDFGFLNNLGVGTVLFHNSGTLRRSGTGTARFDGVPIQNDAGASISITAGTLLVNTSGTFTAGPLSISPGAALRFDAGTDLALSGSYSSTGTGHVDFAGGTLSLGGSPVTFNFPAGVFTISGGVATIQNGTLNNTGAIRVADGSDPDLVNMTLNNSGTITDGGRVDFGGDTTLNNLSGGTFDISFAGDFSFLNNLAGLNNSFHNAGTLKRSATGIAQFNGIPFQNDAGAAITITAGTLLLNSSGSLAAGPLSIATGAALRFDAGTNLTLSGDFASTGAGHIDLTGGTFDLGFGTVGFNFPAGVLTISGGSTTFQNGTLNNSGTVRIADLSDPNFVNMTLNNSGTITDGGQIDFGGDTTLNNQSGGTVDVNSAGDHAFASILAGTNNLFRNAGTLTRSGPGTARTNGVPFQNDLGAAITITAGTLLLNSAGSLAAGPLSIATGAALRFDAGTNLTLNGNFTSAGAGHVDFAVGTLDLGAGTVGINFPAGVFTMSGATTTMQNGTLNNTGTIRIADLSDPDLINVTLNNTGTITDGGRVDFGGDVTLNNQSGGTFEVSLAGDHAFVNLLGGTNNAFHNAGTLLRTNSGSARLDGVSLDNTGTVDVQAGSFVLNAPVTQISGTTLTGGTWDVHSGAGVTFPGVATLATNSANVTLRGTAIAPAFDGLGANTGSLTLLEGRDLTTPADFTNSGTLALGPASLLTVNGTFTQTAAGTTEFQLGGAPASGQFGQVIATGAALDGTAGFSIISGYTPTNGDAFTLMTFPSHTGTFATFTGVVPATGVFLTPVTEGTSFGVNILVDSTAPTSSVTAFPFATTNRPDFHVNWSGSDNAGGAGLATYDVFVSDNSGPFAPFLTGTTATTAVFTGQLNHTYDFYTRAADLVGNIEAAPVTPDATIAVSRTLIPVVKSHTFTDTDGDTYTVKLAGPGTLNAVQLDPAGTDQGPLDYLLADGTTTKSFITVSVKKNKVSGDGIVTIGDVIGTGALGAFTATASNLVMNGLDFAGAIRSIKVRDILTADSELASPAIKVGGVSTDKLTISAGQIHNSTLIQTPGVISSLTATAIDTATVVAAGMGRLTTTSGGMDVNLQVSGAVGPINAKVLAAGVWNAASFGPVKVSGPLTSTITTSGPIGNIIVNGGGVTGSLTADHFGAISMTGGNFTGQITSTTPAAALGKAAALSSLTVSGGDFTGNVRLLGRAGPIAVKASRLGVGGNFIGATINASAIGNISVGKNFVDTIVLAGADLGADHEFGGGDDNFAAGTIGVVKIGGNVTGVRSIVGAGFSRVGGVDSIVGGTASTFTGLTVVGSADASLHFAAGRFKSPPKIAGLLIDPTVDSRFLVG